VDAFENRSLGLLSDPFTPLNNPRLADAGESLAKRSTPSPVPIPRPIHSGWKTGCVTVGFDGLSASGSNTASSTDNDCMFRSFDSRLCNLVSVAMGGVFVVLFMDLILLTLDVSVQADPFPEVDVAEAVVLDTSGDDTLGEAGRAGGRDGDGSEEVGKDDADEADFGV